MSTQPQIRMDYGDRGDFVSRARRRSATKGWAVFFGMPFVWLIPIMMFTGMIGCLLPMYMGFILSPLLTFLLIYSVHLAVNEARRQNGRIIVGYLETAVRLNLPLVPFLTAATYSEKGRRARQLMHLCNALHAGMPVGAALAELPDVPEETVGRIAANEAMGQLRPGVVRTAKLDHMEDDERIETPDRPLFRLYPIFMPLAAIVVLTFIMIFVVPKFKEIFKDFNTSLPGSTSFLIGLSDIFAEDYVGALLILGLVAVLLLLLSMFLTNIFLPSFSLPAFSHIARWFAWRIPVTRSLERTRGMAEMCDLLSTAVNDGATLPGTLQQAELLAVNPGFRTEIVAFRDNLLAGQTPAQAADSAQLPPLLVGLLATPTDSMQSQSAMFGFLARHYRQRFSRTLLLIRSTFEPLFVLVFGSAVGFILFALFSPLVKLISSVSGGTNGGGVL